MNKKKGSKKKDICCYLPPELWTEYILPRLPVQTLLIFRLVCKLWCSTIDDRAFISVHFKLSINNRDKIKLLAIEELGRFLDKHRLTVRSNDTLRKSAHIFTGDRHNCLISCNGLFFIQHYLSRNLKLWNPSIKKSLSLPPCPLVTGNHTTMFYLFGFRPSSDDYVVHAFRVDYYKPVKLSSAAYTLSDNLWRIRNNNVSLPRWTRQTLHNAMYGKESVFHGGALHWFGNDRNNKPSCKTHLVSFNFDTEKFSYIDLPENNNQALEIKTYKFLFVLGESLATYHISSGSSSIWVLKNEVWDLRLRRHSSAVGFEYISDHPHVVTRCFYIKDGGITLVYGNVAYKIMNDEIKELSKSLSSHLLLDPYMESLVLHKGCQGQILTSL